TVSDVGSMLRLPQRPDDIFGRRHFDWFLLASDNDGQLCPRSLLAGRSAPRIARPSGIQTGHRRRMFEMPYADAAISVEVSGQRRRSLLTPEFRFGQSHGSAGAGRRVVFAVPSNHER